MWSYGATGKAYIDWCADMAQSQDIGIPWIMCQQDDAPEPMINTCNGWYCDQFTPNNPNSPKMWTENWTGWFKNWGGKDPIRTAKDLDFSVARFFQFGGTFQNYYMYHGGTNFERTAGGPYITTSYNYDAPIDEFGG